MGEVQINQSILRNKGRWGLNGPLLCLLAASAIAIRVALLPYVSEDSTYFLLPWMQEFRDHGAPALGGEFSNYNFPYLLLIFLASLLPVDPLVAIKLTSLLGDALLAGSVALLFKQFHPARVAPAVAAILAMFLPTVLMNASMWGQCDAIYASFLVLSLRSLLRNDGRLAWVFWGVALSFKLQSVFFLPALLFISLRNRYSPLLPATSVAVWALLSLPPVFFGRTLESTFAVYVNQTQEYRLVAGAANIYTWFPSVTAEQGRIPAIMICGAILLFVAYAYWRGPDNPERRVLLAIAVSAVCPMVLPQMHERYFFVAEVLSLLLIRQSFVRFSSWIFAGTGSFVYILYFQGNQYALPLALASLLQTVAVALLMRALWQWRYPPTVAFRPLVGSNPT
jgi:Gpi18-like mannosyltransferase